MSGKSVNHYAQEALDAAVSKADGVAELVTEMVVTHGPSAIADAAVYWVEATLAQLGPHSRGSLPLKVGFTPDHASVERAEIDSLPPAVRFACRYFFAQANRDTAMVHDLWASVSDNQIVECLFAVLGVCSSTLRNRKLLVRHG